MNILLDTQACIWMVNASPKLGKKSKGLVESTANSLYISNISLFEMTIKSALGKLSFDPSLINALQNEGVKLVSIDEKSLAMYQIFDDSNKDPFDNYLLGLAKSHNLTLMTSDQKILNLKKEAVYCIDARK